MANNYYSLSETAFITDLISALNDKYLDVTVHYSDATYIIFSCPAISNKVIKIYYAYLTAGADFGSAFSVYFGDEWTSGSNITNEIIFAGYLFPAGWTGANFGKYTTFDLILGDDFLLIQTVGSGRDHIAIVCKLSNGNFIARGYCTNTANSWNNSSKGYLLDVSSILGVNLIGLSNSFKTPSGKISSLDLIFSLNDVALINSDNTIATLSGLISASVKSRFTGSNFITTYPVLYSYGGDIGLNTSLLGQF